MMWNATLKVAELYYHKFPAQSSQIYLDLLCPYQPSYFIINLRMFMNQSHFSFLGTTDDFIDVEITFLGC
jgi:hypothetical protein